MGANGNGNGGVSYSEVRWWAVWLDTFTAQDMADALHANLEVGKMAVRALLWHGICEVLEEVDGEDGVEQIVGYKPLPRGPREHETGTPEWRAAPGCYDLAQATGLPVRIRTERQMRRSLSTPGARQFHRQRELAYERQEEARRKRREEDAARSKKDPKWRRPKKRSRPAEE